MKHSLALLAILGASSVGLGNIPPQESAEDEARRVAESFMRLIDSGKYAEAWEQVSEQFKPIEDKEGFVKFYRSAHKRFGRPISRELINVEYQNSSSINGSILKGVIFTYKSEFEHKKGVEETIGVFLEQDDKWHVGAYFIEALD